jgi:hypothetical protein
MSNIETFVEKQVKALLAAAGAIPYGTAELKLTVHDNRITKADQTVIRTVNFRPIDEGEGAND